MKMSNLYIKINAKIKILLGICNVNGCHKRAVADINIKETNIKRCLCQKHLDDLKTKSEEI